MRLESDDEPGDPTKTEEEDLSDGCDEASMTGPDGLGKKKQKRRSKNDFHGRDYKCTFCEKTYLSYPALYTHIKNKHARGPDGQPLIAFNSGRGRGRPKKNSLGSRNQVEPTSRNFFRTIDKVGGPIEPTTSFDEIYTEIFIRKRMRATQSKDRDSEGEDGIEDQYEEKKLNRELDAQADAEPFESKVAAPRDGDEEGKRDLLKMDPDEQEQLARQGTLAA